MFSYRSILRQSWKITKQHKKLWIFGALALILSAGSEYQVLTKILNEDYGSGVYEKIQTGGGITDLSFWSDFGQLCASQPRLGLGLALLIALLTFVLFVVLWVSVKSQISLIKWVKTFNANNSKKKDQDISIWNGISECDGKFWPVLGLNVIFKVGINLLFFILSIPLLYLFFQESSFAILVYTIFFTVFLPIAISLALIIKYAIISVVVDKNSFVKSMEDGYKIFLKNWLVSLEIAILLFLINFLAGLVIIFVISILILPIILTLLIFNFLLPLYFLVIIAFAILIITAAILMTFQTTVWTILFEDLKAKKASAKLERVFKRK
jgi:hypothetical protein